MLRKREQRYECSESANRDTNAPKARTAEFIIFCKLFIEKPKKPINTLLWSAKLRHFEDTSYRNLEFKNLVVGNIIFL